jgi:hypothetical protein
MDSVHFTSPVRRCGAFPQVFLFAGKMTSLDFPDTSFVDFNYLCQYLLLVSLYLSQVNDIYFWGAKLSSPEGLPEASTVFIDLYGLI